MTALRRPFPYFGSKDDVAEVVWQHLGPDLGNYVEPFFGSGAVLFGRPRPGKVETVNDYSGLVSNFWRAVQAAPLEVARFADNPVHEIDLHAWHSLLVDAADGLRASCLADPRFFDAELAGRWAWGASAWIGSGWCDPSALSHSKLPHLSGGGEVGVGYGRGVHARHGRLVPGELEKWMKALSKRMRLVRVVCGDFARVLTPAVTTAHGVTGVFLDPTYARRTAADPAGKIRQLRAPKIYEVEDDTGGPRARAWAIENGDDPMLRIALCGYEGEHAMPEGWTEYAWRTAGGYGLQAADGRGRENAQRERIWFSPHCLRLETQAMLFRTGENAP
jgi:DNA adenine methylase